MVKIKLSDLVDAIEFHSDLSESFINLKTGEIVLISDDIPDDIDDECPDWQREHIKIKKNYLENPDDYIGLPSQYDVNEYRLMEDFVSNIDDEKIAAPLWASLKGKGAFRRFKDNIYILGVGESWYKFRDEKYKEFAREWCEDNEFAIEE